MAKEKKKGEKKIKKAKRTEKVAASPVQAEAIPTEIAGVKVPAKLREAAEQLRELAKNPVAQDFAIDLAAAALMAAAAKIADSKPSKQGAAADTPADNAEGEKPGRKKSVVGDAVKIAVLNAAQTLLDNVEVAPKKAKP